jgi:hypothetical protein
LNRSFPPIENFLSWNEVEVGRPKRNQNIKNKKNVNNATKSLEAECLEKWRLKCKLKRYLKAVEHGEDDNKQIP